MARRVIIIGSGFAGLSAACFMRRAGWEVTVVEKHDSPGGRARQLVADGFRFDMGPSWYWMPDVFENFFEKFGKKVSDYYSLKRLDPSYRIYWDDGYTDVPADYESFKNVFEEMEKGSAVKLEKFLEEACYKYETGINRLVYKPGLSVSEFFNWETISGVIRLDVFTSIRRHISKYFKHPRVQQMMEFPVLFLGALPENTPALYSLMNYADIKGGTWYPGGGMFSVVRGMHLLSEELGVNFHFNEDALEIVTDRYGCRKLITDKQEYEADVIISGADYHFTESKLLQPKDRSYSEKYWDKKVMAPSCLMYYVGLNRKLKNVQHHSLFFDVPFGPHADKIYTNPGWPEKPLFYVSVNSVSDDTVTPPGCENLVFLIPVASGLTGDDETLRNKYFNQILKRFEQRTGQSVSDAVVFKRSYAVSDFASDYNSYKGNAYGLANTLSQTALFRPSCRSRKLKNLFYTGQLTVPGPGVPPSLISGEVVAGEVIKHYSAELVT